MNKIKYDTDKQLKEEIKDIEDEPMSMKELDKYLPNGISKKMIYSQLNDYSDWNNLTQNDKIKYIILLVLHNDREGHYVCLINDDKYIEYFDPYGFDIDKHLMFNTIETNDYLGQGNDYLLDMLKKTNKKVIINKVPFQNLKNLDIATCGRHCLFRINSHYKKNLNLKQYFNLMKKLVIKTGLVPDEIVSYYIK